MGFALQQAAQKDRIPVLECVLKHRPSQWDLDAALDHAVRRDAVAMVRALLAAGASPDACHTYVAPLWAAAESGSVGSLRLLLDAGADPDTFMEDTDAPGGLKLPLLAAISCASVEAVTVLLDAGADIDVITPQVLRPLDIAESLGNPDIVRLLRERGARRVAPEDLEIGQAAERGFVARVRELLPSASVEERGLALVHAVQKRQAETAVEILGHGGIEPGRLRDTMAQSIVYDVPEVLPPLLAAGVDIDSSDTPYSAPPLVLAAERGRVWAVRALVDAGADLQEHGRWDTENALAKARSGGHTEIVQMLRAAGATARTAAAIERSTRKKLADQARTAWTPRLSTAAAPGDPSCFGGLPWLRQGEEWPCCARCQAPLTFVVQVDLGRTPKAAREIFGEGLLQLFHCTTCMPSAVTDIRQVRVIDPAGTAVPDAVPDKAEIFPARPIVGWGHAVKDYPYRDGDESVLLPEERGAAFRLNRQGDKLGGWPNWVQDANYPTCPQGAPHRMTQLVLQICSGEGVPHTWGDNGLGFVVRCPKHRRVGFDWQTA
ncbi:Ankyrin repeat [Thermomonospora echinospora]|uniref:Ankyrin repeat n=1 Tax=Thermomonospora echinospora TaxID=1992 RepID=A0A1H6AJ88_9ACTN|nr:Ankyrin repeat [Thermomonospora echinospora]